jgi:predicted CXXCH cytochrome family protein
MRPVVTLTTLLTAAVLLLSSAAVPAGEASWLPKPARGRGDKCVADTDWMRRNHMTVLMHQRDDTVHDGIRTKRFSLMGCIDCHAVKGADGKPVTVASPKHFCRTCHDYAAVRVDCFECHASRPEAKVATTGQAAPERSSRTDAAVLAQYLRSLEP